MGDTTVAVLGLEKSCEKEKRPYPDSASIVTSSTPRSSEYPPGLTFPRVSNITLSATSKEFSGISFLWRCVFIPPSKRSIFTAFFGITFHL